MYSPLQRNRYMGLKVFLCVLMGVVFCPLGDATAQGDVVLPDLEMNGQMTQNLGQYTLPQDFSFEAEVRIDASNQWRHLVEVGGVEYVWNSPFRLEVGNEGEWYFCVGDGASYQEAYFSGAWRYGDWVKVLFTYVNGVGKFYENGVLLHEAAFNKNVAIPGSLIVGSFQGDNRFFQGAMKNGRIVAGELAPGSASGGEDTLPVDDGLPIVVLSEGAVKNAQGTIWGLSHVKTPALLFGQIYYDCYATSGGQLINDGHLYALHTRVADWGNAIFQVQMRFFQINNQSVHTLVNGVAVGVGDDVVVFKDHGGQLAIEANGQIFSGAIGQLETNRLWLNVQQAGNNIRAEVSLKDDDGTRVVFFYKGPYNGAFYFDSYLHLGNTAFEGKNLGLFGMLPNNQHIGQLWTEIRTVTGDPGFFAVPVEKRLVQ